MNAGKRMLWIVVIIGIGASTGCAEYMARRRAAQAQRRQQIEEQKKQEEAQQQEEERKFKEDLNRLGVSEVLYSWDLFMAYENNEIAADQRFKGKKILIVGPLETVGRDVLEKPYVDLGTVRETITTVRCMFSKDKEGELAKLNAHGHIRIVGKVKGKSIAQIILEDCILYTPPDGLGE